MSVSAKKYVFGCTKDKTQWRFDTIGDNPSSTAFTIRRVSDNVEQNFTYAQITDGTYDAFLGGSVGAVKVWTNGTQNLSKTINADQMYLLSNSGQPYLYNPVNTTGLFGTGIVSKFSKDWIVSVIHGKELNNNNQRCLLGITGDIPWQNIIINPSTDNKAYVKINSTTQNFINSDFSVNITTIDKLDVYTYAKIGGVLTVRKNNTILTQTSSTFSVAMPNANLLNVVTLGNRGNASPTGGKLNKYQHVGHIADADLSGFDLTGYINDLITRYGIT